MIKILIADDHAVVRRGVKHILEEVHDFEVVGEAENGIETIELAQKSQWDIMLLDLSMPGANGLNLLQKVKNIKPDHPVIILSMHPEEQFALPALRLKADGYVEKGSVPKELINAIRKVEEGGKYISPRLEEKIVSNLKTGFDINVPAHGMLSSREYEVFIMIAEGKSIKFISNQMHLSPKTVSTYRARVLEKLRLKTNAELVRYAIKHLLID